MNEKKDMKVEKMAAQFRRPKGWRGRAVARFMEGNSLVAYRWVLDRLDLTEGATVLEIGYGHGWGLCELAQRQPSLRLYGTDFSRLMYRRARRKNRDLIRQGRISLRCGDVLDYDAAGDFDAIFHINVLYFWNDLGAYFRKLHSLLRPGGVLYSFMASAQRLATVPHTQSSIFNKYSPEFVQGELSRTGFRNLPLDTMETDRGPGHLIRSVRPL